MHHPRKLALTVVLLACTAHETQRPPPDPGWVTALCAADDEHLTARLDPDGTDLWTVDCGDDLRLVCDLGAVRSSDGWTCRCDYDYDCEDPLVGIRQSQPSAAPGLVGRCVDERCSWSR